MGGGDVNVDIDIEQKVKKWRVRNGKMIMRE